MRQGICSVNPIVYLLNLERSLSGVRSRTDKETDESSAKRIIAKIQRLAEIHTKYIERRKSFRWQSKGICEEFDSKNIFH